MRPNSIIDRGRTGPLFDEVDDSPYRDKLSPVAMGAATATALVTSVAGLWLLAATAHVVFP